MGLIREPKNVDFIVQSEPWTDDELRDFRVLMNELKSKTTITKRPTTLASRTKTLIKK